MCPVYSIVSLGKEDAGTSERIRDGQITPQSGLRDFRSAARERKKKKTALGKKASDQDLGPGFQS